MHDHKFYIAQPPCELILDNLSNFQIFHKDCRQPNFKTNLQDVWVFQIFLFSKAQQIFDILKNFILENSSCNYVARGGLRTHQVSHQIASGCAVQALAYIPLHQHLSKLGLGLTEGSTSMMVIFPRRWDGNVFFPGHHCFQ